MCAECRIFPTSRSQGCLLGLCLCHPSSSFCQRFYRDVVIQCLDVAVCVHPQYNVSIAMRANGEFFDVHADVGVAVLCSMNSVSP